MDEKLFKRLFIGMFAVNVVIAMFTAFQAHKVRKEEAAERKLRIEDLKIKANGQVK